MSIRRRGLVATIAAATIALTACGSNSETETGGPASVAEATSFAPETLERSPTPTPPVEPEDGLDDEEETPDGTEPVEGEEPEGEGLEGEEPPKPVIPRITPDQVALTFQQALFAGDGAVACAQLTKEATERLVVQGVANGVITEGQTCTNYAVAVANNYADWDVSMEGFPVDQKPRRAHARVEMMLQGQPSQVRMVLVLVGSEWKISDWGSH